MPQKSSPEGFRTGGDMQEQGREKAENQEGTVEWTKKELQELDEGAHPVLPREAVLLKMQDLYWIMSKTKTQDALQLCLDKFATLEQEVNTRLVSRYLVSRYLDRGIGCAKEWEQESANKMHELFFLASSDWVSRNFPKEGAYHTFISHDQNEKAHKWCVYYCGPVLYFRSCHSDKPGLMFAMDGMDGLEKIKNNIRSIEASATKAIEQYEREHARDQVAKLDRYDLPHTGKIIHVRVFPKEYDKLVQASVSTATLLSAVLREKYGRDRVIVCPPVVTDDPYNDIQSAMKKVLRENGLKDDGSAQVHFCLDIFSHGTPTHSHFKNPLTPHKEIAIVKNFFNATFSVNGIQCFGGGGAKIAEEPDFNRDVQERFSRFTQTKGDLVNLNVYDNHREQYLYYLHLMKALKDGKTYGEAHRIADEETKKYLPVDAEAIINGEKFVLHSDWLQHNDGVS